MYSNDKYFKCFKLCYYGSIVVPILIFLSIPIFALISYFVFEGDLTAEAYKVVALGIGGFLLVFAFGMLAYALGRLFTNFGKKSFKENVAMIIFFILFNFMAGYVWFYWDHVKGR